nr:putative chitinase [Pestalotiopsis kenyana]
MASVTLESSATLTSSTSALNPVATSRTAVKRSGFVNGAYFVNWGTYDRNYYPNQLPVKNLSHVYYAFAMQHTNGTVSSTDPVKDAICVQQFRAIKQKNPELKVILSIGGWNASQDESFNSLAASPGRRYIFAASAVHMMQSYGFDGIDIDWEYPKTAADGANLLAVFKELRDALDVLGGQYGGHHFLLSAASPSGPAHYRLWPLQAMAAYLDYFHFMGYDYMGAGYSRRSGHQANLIKSTTNPSSTDYDTESAVDDYIRAGVPPGQIVLGMPLYGRSFSRTRGPGRTYKMPRFGSWVDPANGDGLGVWDYKALPRTGATEHYAADAGATYSYDAGTGEMVSYDTPGMVSLKLDYVLSMKLAGAYFFEASADRTDARSLILTSADKLRNAGGLDKSPGYIYPQ